MNKGKLIVISGPSGAGKGTVIKQVLRRKDNVRSVFPARPELLGRESRKVWIIIMSQKKNLHR